MSVLLQTMREWATFSADICILLITAYTFYITFISKKLKLLSFSVNNSDRGDSFHLVLENRSFAPICIEEIYLVFSGQHKIKFGEYQQPVVLNAFSAIGLSMEPFSFLYPSVSSWEVRNDLVVCVVTSRKNLYTPKGVVCPSGVCQRSSGFLYFQGSHMLIGSGKGGSMSIFCWLSSVARYP